MAAEEAVKQALASIKLVPPGSYAFAASSQSLNKDQLRMLYFLFNKNLEKALRILDNRGVTRVTAKPSGRVAFQVVAETNGLNQYLCFPEQFCSCPAFHFEVVSRGQQLCCKHQLAARLATSLNLLKEVSIRQKIEKYQELPDLPNQRVAIDLYVFAPKFRVLCIGQLLPEAS